MGFCSGSRNAHFLLHIAVVEAGFGVKQYHMALRLHHLSPLLIFALVPLRCTAAVISRYWPQSV